MKKSFWLFFSVITFISGTVFTAVTDNFVGDYFNPNEFHSNKITIDRLNDVRIFFRPEKKFLSVDGCESYFIEQNKKINLKLTSRDIILGSDVKPEERTSLAGLHFAEEQNGDLIVFSVRCKKINGNVNALLTKPADLTPGPFFKLLAEIEG